MSISKLKYCHYILLCILIALSLFSCSTKKRRPQHGEGNVVKILDGDTYDVMVNGIQTRIRMYGIDAPEKGMDFYKVSKDYLASLCQGNEIRIEKTDTDRYGRTIARSYLPDGRELGAEMIKAGLAWHFKKYSSDQDLAQFEIQARENKIGLWINDNPIAPWDYRKSKRGN